MIVLCGTNNLFTGSPMDIAACIVKISGLIPRDDSWSVCRVLMKIVINPSLFFRDSLHLTEEENVKFAKLIVNSIALTNNICFSSNTGKRYSYNDTCKNKSSISFDLTLSEAAFLPSSPPIHVHKCKHSLYPNSCKRDLCETHGSDYVSSTSKPVSAKTVCKHVRIVSCNEPITFFLFFKSLLY